jgi:DNA polymerase
MIGLDFETYSDVDLFTHGLRRYTASPNFQPLLAAVKTHGQETVVIDFAADYEHALAELYGQVVLPVMNMGERIVAHNAGFEREVLRAIGYDLPADAFVDSAVLARAHGAGGSLEAAASQLLGKDKLESGKELIKLFSVGDGPFDTGIAKLYDDDWEDFKHYCAVDAELSLRLYQVLTAIKPMDQEERYAALTLEMNSVGWPVDMSLVECMHAVVYANTAQLESDFLDDIGDSTFNLRSHKQKSEFCRERGVNMPGFDEKNVAKYLPRVIQKRDAEKNKAKEQGYDEVAYLLETLQYMGGSSTSKLDKLIDTVHDGRLYDNYLHIGAGATYRTTGRGVQMQNLPRLNGGGDDVSELMMDRDWTNSKIAHNLRQVFRASHLDGRLIVGDFKSVESRGLAWQAGEQWKLDAYAKGLDIYTMQAVKKYSVAYEDITKPQRTFGKVGELACGYGAGPGAVRGFAEGMGVTLTEAEAIELVKDWREHDPETVKYWHDLDAVLKRAIILGHDQVYTPTDYIEVFMRPVAAPPSLVKQTGDTKLLSIWYGIKLRDASHALFSRVIHGVHIDGRNVGYYKPTSRKTGDLWVNQFTDPKTGFRRKYTIYGGKLAGLLTQSLCRELFFLSLEDFHQQLAAVNNVRIIGQFHDEIVVEWSPEPLGEGAVSLNLSETEQLLGTSMEMNWLPEFPLEAEIHSAYRYIK